MSDCCSFEQLEEGEIVDDDDFEQISDDSIIDVQCSRTGKLVSHSERLRALSLSSISDAEVHQKNHKKRRRKRGRHIKTVKKGPKPEVSDSSDTDCYLDRELKGQLKEAIHISGVAEEHRNSLQTRLERMCKQYVESVELNVEDENQSEPQSQLEPQPEPEPQPQLEGQKDQNAISDKTDIADKSDDKELEALRLEALKTAILNKHNRRKKRKISSGGDKPQGAQTLADNKENAGGQDVQLSKEVAEEPTQKKPCLEQNTDGKPLGGKPLNGDVDVEDDEDVLRAALLAGLSKKITKKVQPEDLVKVISPDPAKKITKDVLVAKVTPLAFPKAAPKQQPLPVNRVAGKTVSKVASPSKLSINRLKLNKRQSKMVQDNIKRRQALLKDVRKVPMVKPLIINVNGDSDSDDDGINKQMTIEIGAKQTIIGRGAKQTTINSGIKQSTIECEVKQIKVSLNNDLNTISDTVDKFLKEQRAKFESQSKKAATKEILEKSSVKWLPKSQQIEYQELLKRIKNAEKNNKRTAAKAAPGLAVNAAVARGKPPLGVATKPVVKVQNLTVKVTPPPDSGAKAAPNAVLKVASPLKAATKVEITPPAKTNLAVKVAPPPISVAKVSSSGQVSPTKLTSRLEVKAANAESDSDIVNRVQEGEQFVKIIEYEKNKSGIINELTMLKDMLRDLRTLLKSKSLQDKYQVLMPVMKKINEASSERKRHENRIRDLLQELGEARNDLSRSHETFSGLVRELVEKKKDIDERTVNGKKPVTNKAAIVDKTMVKKQNEYVTKEDQYVTKTNGQRPLFNGVAVTSTPVRTSGPAPFETSTISNIINDKNTTCEDMDICNSNSEDMDDMNDIDIVDPNDIDQIFRRKRPTSKVPEYVSPLNQYPRYPNVDPLGIMCPYEVNGSCRDVECAYKHYMKS